MARTNLRAVGAADKHYPSPEHPNEVHPDDCPDVYASTASGTCLRPVYDDGASLVFSKSEEPTPGDYVGIWLHPKIVEQGGLPRRVKRLVSGGWPGMTFPYQPAPGNALEPVVILEQLNPPRMFRVRASHILAMHKVIGVAEDMGNGQARYLPVKREGE